MIKATSKVIINAGMIKKISQAQVRALEQTAEALHTEIVQAQVMPRDTGTLQNEKTFVYNSDAQRGISRIISEGPYARRLYFHPEYNFQTAENPNAKGRWFEDWLPGGKEEDFAPDAFKRFYKKEAGI